MAVKSEILGGYPVASPIEMANIVFTLPSTSQVLWLGIRTDITTLGVVSAQSHGTLKQI
jgi:hypothetical protein